jgi:hypothetical protein
MRAELAEALMAGIPVLVPVRTGLLPAWRAFLGEAGDELPPTTSAVLSWACRAGGVTGAWAGYSAVAPILS